MRFLLILLGIILTFFSQVLAFYRNDTQTGWWWYKDYVKEKEEKKEKKQAKEERHQEEKKEESKKEEPKEEKKDLPKEEFKPLTQYSYEELLKMPVSQFQRLFEYYRDLAISDPSNETNVYYFVNLLDVLRKRSLYFMASMMNVIRQNPELDVRRDIPVIQPAMQASVELEKEEEKKAIRALRNEFGLLLFVKSSCPYCEVQKNIVNYLARDGVLIKVIDIEQDKGAVSRFGITVVPFLGLVVRQTGEFYPIGAGVISLSELEARIARILGVARGEKDPSQSFLYQYQVGGSLDPLKPPPLFRKESVKKDRR